MYNCQICKKEFEYFVDVKHIDTGKLCKLTYVCYPCYKVRTRKNIVCEHNKKCFSESADIILI
jgi:hypothetical protein